MTLQWRFDIEAKVTAFLRALPALAILSSAHHWVSNSGSGSGSNCLRLVCLSRSRGGRKSEKEEQNKLVNYLELLPIAAAAAVSRDSDNVRIQRVPNVDTRGAVLYLTLSQSTCVNVRIFFCTYEQQTVIMYVAYSTHWNWTSIISGCLILLCLSVQSLFYLHPWCTYRVRSTLAYVMRRSSNETVAEVFCLNSNQSLSPLWLLYDPYVTRLS